MAKLQASKAAVNLQRQVRIGALLAYRSLMVPALQLPRAKNVCERLVI